METIIDIIEEIEEIEIITDSFLLTEECDVEEGDEIILLK